jgi:uncharacterized DUF497 family protein
VRVEWDDEKAATNRRKHKLSFEKAAEVFDDELHVSVDDKFSNYERRFITIGLVSDVGLVVVVHTMENEGTEDEYVRIISARRAERHERKAYENG